MRFFVTMNMPTRNKAAKIGPPTMVHTIIAEAPVHSLEQFVEWINANQFIIVDEVHNDYDSGTQFISGKIILNTNLIGKVKSE